MDKTMSQRTRTEVLNKLRRRYKSAGAEHKRKLLDQAQELLGYHRKSAIRALGAPTIVRGPLIITGRPVAYEPGRLLPWLRPIVRGGGDVAQNRRLGNAPEFSELIWHKKRPVDFSTSLRFCGLISGYGSSI